MVTAIDVIWYSRYNVSILFASPVGPQVNLLSWVKNESSIISQGKSTIGTKSTNVQH